MEAVMTDFQFKSIIKMVIGLVEKSKSTEELLKELKELLTDKAEK